MDETIGVKGGHNDRLRTLKITKEQKQKLEEKEEERQLKELEKDVRKKQLYTLIKTVPIFVGLGAFNLLTSKQKEEEKEEKQEVLEIETPKEEKKPDNTKQVKVVVFISGKQKEIYVPIKESNIIKEQVDQPEQLKPIEEQEAIEVKPVETPKQVETNIDLDIPKDNENIEILEESKVIDAISTSDIIDIFEISTEEFKKEPDIFQETIERVSNKKVLDYYTKELKELEYELKDIIKEYDELVKEEKDAKVTKKLEVVIDKLDEIIVKIDELKDKLKLENLNQKEEKELYSLIQESFSYYEKEEVIEEIKKTPLYNRLSKKIEELDKKKDEFQKEVDYKMDDLEEKENDFDNFKSTYSNIEKMNKDLIDFQLKQERLLADIKRKVEESTTVTERVETELVGLSAQQRQLYLMLSAGFFLALPKKSQYYAAAIAAYLYFMENVINPHTETKKYKVIKVKDYSDIINDSLIQIEDSIDLLNKTSKQVDNMIKEIKEKYADYLDIMPECKRIFSELYKIKEELKENELEMKRIKREQEKEYEKNKEKVKTMGEYRVN